MADSARPQEKDSSSEVATNGVHQNIETKPTSGDNVVANGETNDVEERISLSTIMAVFVSPGP